MKAILTFIAALLLCTFSMQGQTDETLVSKFKLDFSGAWGGWHPTLTQVGEQDVVMNGGFGGLEFNKTLFIGWAAYQVSDRIGEDGSANAGNKFDFSYNGPTIQYTPMAASVIHPKFGLQVGFGSFNLGGAADNDPIVKDKLLVLQPSAGGELNVLRWFRLGADVGYRYTLNGDSNIGDLYADGFYAAATLKFGFSWGQ